MIPMLRTFSNFTSLAKPCLRTGHRPDRPVQKQDEKNLTMAAARDEWGGMGCFYQQALILSM